MLPVRPNHLSLASLNLDPADRSVLVVDDENGVRDLMSRWLQSGGYEVASACGASEALDIMEQTPPAVALCDIRMPGHDGLWLADRIRQLHPDTAIIMATGFHDLGAATASLQHGVVDYLTKPFGRERLRDAVGRGIEWHRSARDWRERLEGEVEERHAQLERAIRSLVVESDDAVEQLLQQALGTSLPARRHAFRVAELSTAIAARLGLSADEIAVIGRAALLHDLGKLTMPEALVSKPAPLTAEEQTIMRRYPGIGAELLTAFPYLDEAAVVVRHIQERLDGLGYPAGLTLPDLPLGSRIVAAADAYDTMTRPRVFRDAATPADALLELERCAGSQFDPDVVRALKAVVAAH